MTETFMQLHPVVQALLAGAFTWALSAAGAALIFAVRKPDQRLFDFMLGFTGGVMLAAAFWSLLAPAVGLTCQSNGRTDWLPPAVGFLAGTIFLWLLDRLLPHLHPGFSSAKAEGLHTSWRRSVLLVMAITLHNIPEGLAVGVAVGAAASGFPGATYAAVLALALGIGIQDIVEGFAVSASLRGIGLTRFKSFWYGQLSAVVEPLGAALGTVAVMQALPLMPYGLGFAAGAMIYVVIEEVIPASLRHGHTHLAAMGTVTGFFVMMILDAALG